MRNNPHIYTTEETNWIINNYPIHGSKYCAEKMKLSIEQVRGKVSRMKLNKADKINVEQFKNIKTKEVAYIMGFIWADGHVTKKTKCRIHVNIVKEDMEEIKNIFFETGKWNHHNRKYQYREQGQIDIGSKSLHKIFCDYDYQHKSHISPFKIIESIPEKLKNYFFRGLSDGDGCFYINKKHYTYQYILSSTHEQNWKYMIDLCEKLNIKYRIDRVINKKSKYSAFRICRKNDVIIFGNYIYNDFNFGLNRKHKKFLEIKNN